MNESRCTYMYVLFSYVQWINKYNNFYDLPCFDKVCRHVNVLSKPGTPFRTLIKRDFARLYEILFYLIYFLVYR